MKRSIDFSEPQMTWLKKEADKLGLPISELVRRIIDAERERKR